MWPFNPYFPSVTFLYPLKTPWNLRFSDVFMGYRNVTLGEYGLKDTWHQWAKISKKRRYFILTSCNIFLHHIKAMVRCAHVSYTTLRYFIGFLSMIWRDFAQYINKNVHWKTDLLAEGLQVKKMINFEKICTKSKFAVKRFYICALCTI